MKKFIAIILIIILCVVVTACGDKESNKSESDSAAENQARVDELYVGIAKRNHGVDLTKKMSIGALTVRLPEDWEGYNRSDDESSDDNGESYFFYKNKTFYFMIFKLKSSIDITPKTVANMLIGLKDIPADSKIIDGSRYSTNGVTVFYAKDNVVFKREIFMSKSDSKTIYQILYGLNDSSPEDFKAVMESISIDDDTFLKKE